MKKQMKQKKQGTTLRALETKLNRQVGNAVALTEDELRSIVGGLKYGCDASTP